MDTEKPLAPQESLQSPLQGIPSPKAQQWGVVISIIVIVGMIVIGAFYAWGERIAEEQAPVVPSQSL